MNFVLSQFFSKKSLHTSSKFKKKIKLLLGETMYVFVYRTTTKLNPFKRYFREKERVEMRYRFYSTFVRQNDLCFDVGANYGNRVKAFIDLKAKVIAIEPQTKCCEFLHKKFGEKVIVINKGLGAKEETKNFYETDLSALSSFSEEWIESVKQTRFKRHTWTTSKEIEIVTLDNLIAQYGIPDFIKIDVEGYELEVLSGLSMPVRMISFEYTVPEKTERVISCIKKVEGLNNNIECNYSVGEAMEFALQEWAPVRKMLDIVNSEQFNSTSAGDIYIRQLGTQLKH